MTSSAILVAWSATRSRFRATSRASSAWRVVSGRSFMVFTSVMNASSRIRSTTLSISSTACASSALASMKDSSERRTIALTAADMRPMSTGKSTAGRLTISITRSAMLTAWSPTRSRSALILVTARMKRRSTAIGCCMARRSKASSSIWRSEMLICVSPSSTIWQRVKSRSR